MSVASKQLALSELLGNSQQTLYNVPSGKRTIVKSIVVTNLDSTARVIIFAIKTGSTEDATFNINVAASPAAGHSVMTLPWIVLEVGQSLAAQTNGGTSRVIVSGTELTL